MWWPSLWVLLGSVALSSSQEEFVTVQVTEGLLRGYLTTSVSGTPYYSFQGIPYAAPPVGDLRFVEPQPASSWEGVRNATEDATECVQSSGSGSEDCLYLNVYTPEVNPAEPKAVMVWIHPGGFQFSSPAKSEYGPDFFMDADVVVAAIAYRLGPLGFMSTQDEALPGNLGLKDQAAGLRWLFDNIASFGGDPTDITLFGQSAGSGCVGLAVFSPLVEGVITKVILQSFPPIGPLIFTREPRQKAFMLGEWFGYQGNDSQELVDFLRTVDASELVGNYDRVITEEESIQVSSVFPWLPVIEPDLPGAFLAGSPDELAKQGAFNNLSVLAGVTTAEGNFLINSIGLFTNDAELALINSNFSEVVGYDIRGANTTEQREFLSALVHDYYFGAGVEITNTEEGIQNASYMFTDIYFSEPVDSLLHAMADSATRPIYYYEFAYRDENTPLPQFPGVSHAADLTFEWVMQSRTQTFDPESEENQIRVKFVGYLSNFAKYGTPTPDALPLEWLPFNDASGFNYLLFNATDSLLQNKDEERMQFWRQNLPL